MLTFPSIFKNTDERNKNTLKNIRKPMFSSGELLVFFSCLANQGKRSFNEIIEVLANFTNLLYGVKS